MASVSRVNVTEMDEGENVTAMTCLTASIAEPRKGEARFEIVTNPYTTTATEGNDYVISNYIVIPVGFSGDFEDCVEVVVIGDTVTEADEVFEAEIVPSSSARDSVQFPEGSSFVVNIIDNEGETAFLKPPSIFCSNQ